MASFQMNGVDLGKFNIACKTLTDAIDRLLEIDRIQSEVDYEPVTDIDRTPPHSDYGVQDFVLDSALSSIG